MTRAKEQKFMIDADKEQYIKNVVKLFIEKERQSFETRYKSWSSCHKYFLELHNKYGGKKFKDLNKTEQSLALLNLSFYLASWGMYRGSSFALQYDNTIFTKVIDIVLDSKYNLLWDIDYNKIINEREQVKKLLIDIRDGINKALIDYRVFYNTKSIFKAKYKDEAIISQTLTTKILLGTLCCCPAYDTYFSNSISGTFSNFNDNEKIDNLLELVSRNKVFAELSKETKYPLMKIVDMAYFNMGMEKDFKNYYQKYILTLNEPTPNEWKKVVKSIKQFYYKMNDKEDYEIHVGFECDKKQVDKFINKYKTKIDNILLSLSEEK